MILSMRLDIPEDDLKRCISTAHELRFDEPLLVKDLQIGDEVLKSDIHNIFMGSSIGQLIEDNSFSMIRME